MTSRGISFVLAGALAVSAAVMQASHDKLTETLIASNQGLDQSESAHAISSNARRMSWTKSKCTRVSTAESSRPSSRPVRKLFDDQQGGAPKK